MLDKFELKSATTASQVEAHQLPLTEAGPLYRVMAICIRSSNFERFRIRCVLPVIDTLVKEFSILTIRTVPQAISWPVCQN